MFQDYEVGKIYYMQFDLVCEGCMHEYTLKTGTTYGGHDTHNNILCDLFYYLENTACPNCGVEKHRVYVPCDGVFSGGLFSLVSVETTIADPA